MKNSKLFRSFIGFIALVIVLLTPGSTQECSAQFGLFDTVWTTKDYESPWIDRIVKSNNDSLIFLYRKTDSNIVLVNTQNINQVIWERPYSHFTLPYKFINNDNSMLLLERDLNASKAHLKIRDTKTFEVLDSLDYNSINFPYNNCTIQNLGISETDTSIYYWGYCGSFAIKGISYKVNYRTGQTTITSDSLPYFAMTISEDGQYVAGVYYKEWGGYYEILEVRKISDYSLVFREESKYSDWEPNFAPYQWATKYIFEFSKDNKYLVLTKNKIYIYNLITGQTIFEKAGNAKQSTFSNNNILFFLRRQIDDDKSEKIKACIYDCNNEIYLERDFPDSTNQLIFHSDNIVFNNNYVLCHMLNKYNKSTNYSGFADIALLSLNFDLTSIENKIPESNGILYPNPATEYITVEVPNIESLQGIELYNIFGECVLSVETGLRPVSTKIDVSVLPPGLYFMKVGNAKPMKFMVVR